MTHKTSTTGKESMESGVTHRHLPNPSVSKKPGEDEVLCPELLG